MKRDWKLIRKILTRLEADRTIDEILDNSITLQHIQLLQDANYIDGNWVEEGSGRTPRITMKGYDLLEYLGNGIVVEELTEMGYPITEYTLEKYAEFLMGRDLLDEEDSEFVD